MPRLFEILDGFSVYMYFEDHNPPHVHIYEGSPKNPISMAIIVLGTWEILKVKNFTQKDLKRIVAELTKRKEKLYEKWQEFKEG